MKGKINKRIWIFQLVFFYIVCFSLNTTAEVIYSDDMLTISGWNEDSNAVNEPGDTTGGIRVADYGGESYYPDEQLVGWGRLDKHLERYQSTFAGPIRYISLRFSMRSYANGKAVTLKFMDVDEDWMVLHSARSQSEYTFVH